ncbi:hypothetical protein [Streptomyces sp. NPDC047042]|uniref:hypothetical protein n=1 Tax=Streptomyces sp. NPDC047042 TaxID=3154807 RepID=UPI0033ED81D6
MAQPSGYKKLPGSSGGLRSAAGTLVEGLDLAGYEIFGGNVRAVEDPRLRPTFRDIILRDSKIRDCVFESALLERVTVDGLVVDDGDFFRVVACAFRRVELRGRIDNVLIVPRLPPYPVNFREIYNRANGEHWVDLLSDDDWALDISEVSGSLDLRAGIPARLIRRDPRTQVVMTSQQAADGGWRTVQGIERSGLGTQIELFSQSGFRDFVLIAKKGLPYFSEQVDMIRKLQSIGAAMPD